MSESLLVRLLARPRPVLLDGAVGTELSRRGVRTTLPLWSAHALLDDRGLETLTAIHADYARAGAEILVTNTFRTTLRALSRGGAAGSWRLVNRRAVECARSGAHVGDSDARARARDVARSAAGLPLVAGGLAP